MVAFSGLDHASRELPISSFNVLDFCICFVKLNVLLIECFKQIREFLSILYELCCFCRFVRLFSHILVLTPLCDPTPEICSISLCETPIVLLLLLLLFFYLTLIAFTMRVILLWRQFLVIRVELRVFTFVSAKSLILGDCFEFIKLALLPMPMKKFTHGHIFPAKPARLRLSNTFLVILLHSLLAPLIVSLFPWSFLTIQAFSYLNIRLLMMYFSPGTYFRSHLFLRRLNNSLRWLIFHFFKNNYKSNLWYQKYR